MILCAPVQRQFRVVYVTRKHSREIIEKQQEESEQPLQQPLLLFVSWEWIGIHGVSCHHEILCRQVKKQPPPSAQNFYRRNIRKNGYKNRDLTSHEWKENCVNITHRLRACVRAYLQLGYYHGHRARDEKWPGLKWVCPRINLFSLFFPSFSLSLLRAPSVLPSFVRRGGIISHPAREKRKFQWRRKKEEKRKYLPFSPGSSSFSFFPLLGLSSIQCPKLQAKKKESECSVRIYSRMGISSIVA